MGSTLLPSKVTVYSLLYFLCFLNEGMVIGSLGPSIPIKAKLSNQLEIDYSLVFTFMGFGFVIGCTLVTYIEKLVGSHKTITLGLVTIATLCFLNRSENSVLWNAVEWMIIAINDSFLTVSAQVGIIAIQTTGLNSWLQALHFGYGIGSSLSPLLISFFGPDIIMVFSMIALTLGVIIFFLEEPQKMISNQNKQQVNEPQGMIVDEEFVYKLAKLVGLYLLVYVGIEGSYGGWVSTYTTVEGIADEQSAGLTASLFWIFITVGRFIAISAAAKYPAYQYLKFLIIFMLVVSSLCLILLVLQQKFIVVYVGSALLGLGCSAMYPLAISMPIAFGYHLSSQNTAIISRIGVAGLTFIPLLSGYAMKLFGSYMLYANTFLLTCVLYLIHRAIMSRKPVIEIASADSQQLQEGVETLEEIKTDNI